MGLEEGIDKIQQTFYYSKISCNKINDPGW